MAAPTRLSFGMVLRGTDGIEESARRIEDAGFDYLASGEHVAFHVPTPNNFITLAVAAGATTRIRLLSAVTILPLYPPVLAAKLAAALDVASRGRLVLGVGVGGEYPREFEACGVPRHERGARCDEALDVMTRLWEGGPVTYRGRFTTLQDIAIAPAPVQRPHPPIWIAGRSDAAVRRAARVGDGWMPYLFSPERFASSLTSLARHGEALGRDVSTVTPVLHVFACVHRDRDAAIAHAVRALGSTYAQDFQDKAGRMTIVGTPADCRARLAQYVDAGARTLVFGSACDAAHLEEHQRLLVDEVIAPFR